MTAEDARALGVFGFPEKKDTEPLTFFFCALVEGKGGGGNIPTPLFRSYSRGRGGCCQGERPPARFGGLPFCVIGQRPWRARKKRGGKRGNVGVLNRWKVCPDWTKRRNPALADALRFSGHGKNRASQNREKKGEGCEAADLSLSLDQGGRGEIGRREVAPPFYLAGRKV